ncbi:putative phosphodiesterase [Pedobacter sp. CG_S7]|uniref:metallophosphoesterase family protein n=1 Tax=Pedobacter sp. CG_S7 TaxID=3143930 RepID=UPI003397EFF9
MSEESSFSLIKRRSFLSGLSKASLLMCLPLPALAANDTTAPNEGLTGIQFLSDPYLQNCTEHSVTVMWLTNNDCLSWVELIAPDNTRKKCFTEAHGLVSAGKGLHKIKLLDLLPDTNYRYEVFSKEIEDFHPYHLVYGETIKKGPFSFKTFSAQQDEVRFVVLNDLHDHPDNITEMMAAGCKPSDYDFVVLNGDAFDYVSDEAQILRNVLVPATSIFASEKPFLMVQGNHEVRGKFARQLFSYFDYPKGNSYYAFTQGPVRFIVMDAGEDKDDDHAEYGGLISFNPYREAQALWLEKEIENPAFKTAAFRVVLIHIPVFHSGEGHGSLHCRKLFNPLFNKGKIDLSLSGHTHRYGTYDADEATHNYPIVIGGGPGTAVRKDGRRTLIKVHATKTSLALDMLTDDGKIVGAYRLKK